MSKTKVVITGAGGGGANNIITTIKEREEYFLIGFDISEYKVARANVDQRFVVPPASASDYEERISGIISEQKPALIIPTNDPEVEKLSEIRERLDTQLFFPDHESVALCLNKWNFYNFAVENGIRMADLPCGKSG